MFLNDSWNRKVGIDSRVNILSKFMRLIKYACRDFHFGCITFQTYVLGVLINLLYLITIPLLPFCFHVKTLKQFTTSKQIGNVHLVNKSYFLFCVEHNVLCSNVFNVGNKRSKSYTPAAKEMTSIICIPFFASHL